MSMYTTVKTRKEMLDLIATLEEPICLSINYDSDENEYILWTGNQLENYIRKLEKEKGDLQFILEETIEKLEAGIKTLRSSKNHRKEQLSIEHILVTSQEEATSKIYLPTFGDVDVYVYDHRMYKGGYLIVIPYLGWSSYVNEFYNFDKTTSSNGIECGVAKKLGDIKINVPELELYTLEIKLIFSLIISLLYKESQNVDRHFELNIEEHIEFCKNELENCGVDLTYTLFE
ncbi:hypothetical protein [Bacillus cereus]|uniref:hypothetical protein n=1 Tax=Bacillus cereus TaxID=1396 RepID=UPI0021112FF5|nr:hypothetical protein [Bacillus cereus]